MRNLDFQINQQQQQQQHLQNPISFQETQPHNLEIQHPNLYHQLLQNNQDYANNNSLNPSQPEEVPPASRQNARGRQRTGVKSSAGEIVQVQGGHIVRSIGRKDRHSKVCTAKGPRDRRVRLSAHTAIEFYDVQDRLGYDRPSKAVDWLIKKAKSAIDKLAELPPWNPTDNANNNDQNMETEEQNVESSHEMNIGEQSDASGYNFQVRNNNETAASFVSSIDPDTMKSLFPTSSSTYPHQDLGLSLHSFQYQGLIEGQSHSQPGTSSHTPSNHLSAGSAYESNMMSWSNNTNSTESTRGGVGGGGIGFSFSPLSMPLQQVILNQDSSQLFSQRGSLQSNFSQFRAWNDQQITIASAEQQRNQEIHHQPFIFGSRFTTERLVAGYNIPARIRGDEDQSLVNSDHRPSTSPNSQH